ncbi:unnamed protein product [Cylicostephanus goldi]|uniref:Uncharacterized protein n=1 Tax=Cylicostephanus goldi TaxID=71465 RepID=A0A3P6R9R9_CYLGO|nr:unnamed protein product [Cylicostephanus goldi]
MKGRDLCRENGDSNQWRAEDQRFSEQCCFEWKRTRAGNLVVTTQQSTALYTRGTHRTHRTRMQPPNSTIVALLERLDLDRSA